MVFVPLFMIFVSFVSDVERRKVLEMEGGRVKSNKLVI